jgi:hypothetical protein
VLENVEEDDRVKDAVGKGQFIECIGADRGEVSTVTQSLEIDVEPDCLIVPIARTARRLALVPQPISSTREQPPRVGPRSRRRLSRRTRCHQ